MAGNPRFADDEQILICVHCDRVLWACIESPCETMSKDVEAKPAWAWSSVDDPNPHYPKCDHCTAFARWSIARAEDVGPPLSGRISFFVRWFACGSHINRALTEGDWLMDEVHVYDLTYPPERS